MGENSTGDLPAIFSVNEFIAGWIGGAGGVIIGHPLDTLKLRMQTANARSLASNWPQTAGTIAKSSENVHLLQIFQKMFENEGARSVFRGMSFPLLSAGVINSIYFGTIQAASRVIRNLYSSSDDSARQRYTTACFAGTIGGATQLSIAVPVEVVKIRLQARTDRLEQQRLTEAFRVCRDIVRKSGVRRGLYRGFSVQAARDIISSSMYIVIYEFLLDTFNKRSEGQGRGRENVSSTSILIAGGFAGMVSWQVIIPFDVIKSRLQASDPLKDAASSSRPKQWLPYRKLFNAWQKVVREEGWRGLTRGSLPVALRAFPTNAAIFYFYEKSHAYLKTIATNSEK